MFQVNYRERFHSVATISRELTLAVAELERLRGALAQCQKAEDLQRVKALAAKALNDRGQS